MVSIDLGSNTIRGIEVNCVTLKKVAEYEKIVKTADKLYETGRISDKAVDRIINTIDTMKQYLDFKSGVVAVTTEAIRRAKNSLEVLESIKEATGIDFQIIDGKQEAYYTLLAVVTRLEKLNLKIKDFVLADIGGGSTELIFFNDNRVNVKSFPIGIVTIAQKYKTKENIIENLPSEMDEIKVFIDGYYKVAKKPDMFISTAGTPTTVAAMKLGMNYKTYDAERINGVYLQKDDLEEQMERLLSLDEKSRQELVGVGREDLIVAGILIFRYLYDLLGFDNACVVDDGLREGVAIAKCKQLNIDEIFH